MYSSDKHIFGKWGIALSLVLVGMCHLQAQTVLKLSEVLNTIDQNHPELKMFDQQASAYSAYAEGAKAWEPMQVGAGFFMTPYNPSNWGAQTMDAGNGMSTASPGMGQMMVQVQQMIPNPAKLKANGKYMQSMSGMEKANRGVAKNMLFSDAKMNYFELAMLSKKKTLYAANTSLLGTMLQQAEQRFPVRQENLRAVYKAKAMLEEARTMEVMNETESLWKQSELNSLMNRDKNLLFEVDTNIILKNYDTQPLDTQRINDVRSDLISLNRSMDIARLKQIVEKTKAKPDFGVQYGHMFAFGNNPNLFTLMGMVTIPVLPWSSKMYKSNVKGIEYQLSAYEKQKENILNEATGRLVGLRYRMAGKKRQLKLYGEGIIPALKKSQQTAMLAYRQNTGTLMEVLQTGQTLLLAQIEYLNQLQELLQLQVEFEKELEIF